MSKNTANIIRVVLDTNVCRALANDSESCWYNDFIAMKREGIEFCLADIAIVELINQFQQNAIDCNDWRKITTKLKDIISRNFPILPGRRQLFHMSGITEKEDPETFDEEFEECYSQKSFEAIINSDQPWNLPQKIELNVNGRKYNCESLFEKVSEELQKIRDDWSRRIKQTSKKQKELNINNSKDNFGISNGEIIRQILGRRGQALEVQRQNEELLYCLMSESIDRDFSSQDVKPSERMNLLIRYRAHLIAKTASLYEPYNPDSKKRRNDGIDMQLLFTLMLPARICSKDMLKIPRGLEVRQAAWILTPEELVEEWRNKKLKPLSF